MTNDNGAKLFCLGLGIGVATAFLLAPKSGRDSREYLKDRMNDGSDYLKRQGQDLTNCVSEALDQGVEAVRHQRDSVLAAVNAGREAYRTNAAATPGGPAI